MDGKDIRDSKDGSRRKSGILRCRTTLVRMKKRIFNGYNDAKPFSSE
jgi:hypothetical protein